MFIAMNRFNVRNGREADFEEQWRSRETYLKGVPGFVAFALLRSQPIPGHGAPAEHAAHSHEEHGAQGHDAHDQAAHSHDTHDHGAHEHHDHEHSAHTYAHDHGSHDHGHQHDAHGHEAHGAHDAVPTATEYVSHTTWRDQAAFDAWRQSDVFRLAHAQGSVEGVLMGPPVVAIYSSVMEEAGEPMNA